VVERVASGHNGAVDLRSLGIWGKGCRLIAAGVCTHVFLADSQIRTIFYAQFAQNTSEFCTRHFAFCLAGKQLRAIGGAKLPSFARRMWGSPESGAKLNRLALRHKHF